MSSLEFLMTCCFSSLSQDWRPSSSWSPSWTRKTEKEELREEEGREQQQQRRQQQKKR